MQWVIKGIAYDTAVAEKIYSRNDARPRVRPPVTPMRETLYRAKNGRYFVYIQGQSAQRNDVAVLHVLPVTRDKALDWCAEAGIELGAIDKHLGKAYPYTDSD